MADSDISHTYDTSTLKHEADLLIAVYSAAAHFSSGVEIVRNPKTGRIISAAASKAVETYKVVEYPYGKEPS